MPTLIDAALLILAIGILIPMTVFCAECAASVLFARSKREPFDDSRPRTVVLIPAHDEAAIIGETMTQLTPTLRPGDRVLVVADNCSDRTADIARTFGAEVVERKDAARRGKSYALECGLAELAADPPDVVVVLDADCRVDEMTVRRISDAADRSERPVQALNLCRADVRSGEVSVVSELGFRFKNLVRPLGCARLGLPCHLMGTGMAVPWDLLQTASFADDHLAEDMQLGIELALRGRPAVFCPEASITSALPNGGTSFIAQRTRWEQGHLQTMIAQMPRLLWAGIRRCDPALLFLAMDLTVPPLSLLIVCWLAVLTATVGAGLSGGAWLPAVLLACGGGVMTATVLAGWVRFCRDRIPLRSLASIPAYVLRKVPIYVRFFFGRRQRDWLRTERDAVFRNRAEIGCRFSRRQQ
ncbi:MAG: glycosyltransferase family 2 protein [Planctomycetaceae bacterium]